MLTGQLARLTGLVALGAGGYLIERAWRFLLRERTTGPKARERAGRTRGPLASVPWVAIASVVVGLVLLLFPRGG